MSAVGHPPAAEISIVGSARFPDTRQPGFSSWIELLVREQAAAADSFAIRFVGDRTMRALNRTFRGVDATTDVLSFAGEEGPEGRHLGDVVISVPTARRQAGARARPLASELRCLILHGLLHCLGYDHERDDGEMQQLESRLRRRYLAGVFG